MHPVRRLVVAIFGLIVAASVITPAQSSWRRVDSPHFVVIGNVSGAALRDIATRFEGFREALGRVLGSRSIDAAVPTVVVVFPNARAMEPYSPTFNGKPVKLAGLFVPGRDLNYIALVDDNDRGRLRTVFHEFVHLVTSSANHPAPLWVKEGLAEFYSTFEVLKGGREAILGGLIENHILELNDTNLIPIAELVRIDNTSPLYNEGNRRSVFYAQSWALMHRILLGEPSRVAQLTNYLDRLGRNEDAVAAWQAAFAGLSMDQELDRYIRQAAYRGMKYQFGDAIAKLEVTPVTIPPGDVPAYLADLLVELDHYDDAAAHLAKADPTSARTQTTSARLAMARGQASTVAPGLDSIGTPDDWLVAYLAGTTIADRQQRQGTVSPAEIDVARLLLTSTRMGGAEIPNALARAAQLELNAGSVPSAETEAALQRARERAPARYSYTFLHAQILARRGELARARETLAPLMSHFTREVRDSARQLMGMIVERELNRTAAGERPTAPAPGAPTTGATSASATGSGSRSTTAPPGLGTAPPRRSVPVFRTLQTGEQRFEAVLERIGCEPGKGVSFYLKVGDASSTVSAATLADVEFRTHRDDVGGTINCGPMKTPMPVYVTWRPGAIEGSRVVVAIEFLPRR